MEFPRYDLCAVHPADIKIVKCYIPGSPNIYWVIDIASGIQLRFKDDGVYIAIIKDGKLTRGNIEALIKEALKRNRIVDLHGRDLRNLNMSNMSLGRSNMSNADMSNSNLSHTAFFNANLSSSILSNANLSFTDFSFAILSKAKTMGTSFVNSNLFKTVMP